MNLPAETSPSDAHLASLRSAERAAGATAGTTKTNLLDLDRDALVAFMGSLGEKPFRARQILKWLHQRRVLDVDAMTDVSAKTRARLAEITTTDLPTVRLDQRSRDGTALPATAHRDS